MFHWNRRQFLARSGAGSGAALAAPDASSESETAIDFRYAPFSGQTAFCFPDDPAKSLVGDRGELRYGYANGRFETVVAFSFSGVEPDVVARQELESPAVPIMHTRIDRAEAYAPRKDGPRRMSSWWNRGAPSRVKETLCIWTTTGAVPFARREACYKSRFEPTV